MKKCLIMKTTKTQIYLFYFELDRQQTIAKKKQQ